MRREFHPILLDRMRRDDRIRVILGDLGYRMFDGITAEFPDRVFNVGAAEQLAMGVAVGMTYEGLIPIVYSITPFALFRPSEWIRNYLNHEKAPVHIVAAGRNSDYHEDGFTHYAGDDRAFLSLFPNVRGYWPETVAELPNVIDTWLHDGQASYLNLKR